MATLSTVGGTSSGCCFALTLMGGYHAHEGRKPPISWQRVDCSTLYVLYFFISPSNKVYISLSGYVWFPFHVRVKPPVCSRRRHFSIGLYAQRKCMGNIRKDLGKILKSRRVGQGVLVMRRHDRCAATKPSPKLHMRTPVLALNWSVYF